MRTIRPAEIQALYEHRPRWPVYAGFSLATVVLGAVTSALLAPHLAPLTAAEGALLGVLAGAFAAAVVPGLLPSLGPVAYQRLLERPGPWAYWRSVLPRADG